jgi:hypothetical protein
MHAEVSSNQNLAIELCKYDDNLQKIAYLKNRTFRDVRKGLPSFGRSCLQLQHGPIYVT